MEETTRWTTDDWLSQIHQEYDHQRQLAQDNRDKEQWTLCRIHYGTCATLALFLARYYRDAGQSTEAQTWKTRSERFWKISMTRKNQRAANIGATMP